jgi:putative glutamine amidotransferase
VNRRIAVVRWEHVAGERIEAYHERLREAGLEPVDMSGAGVNLDGVHGLVLTGGIDVDPARYGERPLPEVDAIDPARDEFEVTLLADALTRGMPVLAICRGHQLLNVHFGGKLLQHIENGMHVAEDDEPYTSRAHAVKLTSDSRFATWLGTDTPAVNSRHHQAVTPERLAPGLRATGVTADGLIEAVESERHAWVIGVQWHPERLEPQMPGFAAASARLWAAFRDGVEGGTA